MLVFLIWAKSVKSLNSHDSDNSAEHVSLFEIDVDQIRCTIFDMLDGFANVAYLKFRRKRGGTVEALSVERHCNSKFSRFIEHCKPRLDQVIQERNSLNIGFAASFEA